MQGTKCKAESEYEMSYRYTKWNELQIYKAESEYEMNYRYTKRRVNMKWATDIPSMNTHIIIIFQDVNVTKHVKYICKSEYARNK